jgi:hypothetical protein
MENVTCQLNITDGATTIRIIDVLLKASLYQKNYVTIEIRVCTVLIVVSRCERFRQTKKLTREKNGIKLNCNIIYLLAYKSIVTMKKPLSIEMDLDQSIKILNLNIEGIKYRLLNQEMEDNVRKDLETKISQMTFSLEDLQKKKLKQDTSRSKPRMISHKQERPMNKREIEALINLVENPLPEQIIEKENKLYSGLY